MKVLHLPTSVGGNSWGLSKAERTLGLDSNVLVAKQNWLNYNADINLHIEDKNFINQVYTLYKTFTEIKDKYDVFHFNYGSSLLDFQKLGMPLLELPYYNQSKKIIFTYNGSDSRGVHPLEYWDDLPNPKQSLYNKIAIEIKKLKIKKVSKYADHIFALNPDLLDYLPTQATFLPYTIAEWDKIEYVNKDIKNRFKIVHSPTSRDLKGSKYILESLKILEKRYKNIEIIVIENVPYEKALKLYKEADLIIDQVLIGWYGAFGVEIMKMGIPLAVNIREKDLRHIPIDMKKDLEDAIINITPFNIVDKLSLYLENPSLLKQKQKAGLEYVYKWHDPLYISSITKEVYEK